MRGCIEEKNVHRETLNSFEFYSSDVGEMKTSFTLLKTKKRNKSSALMLLWPQSVRSRIGQSCPEIQDCWDSMPRMWLFVKACLSCSQHEVIPLRKVSQWETKAEGSGWGGWTGHNGQWRQEMIVYEGHQHLLLDFGAQWGGKSKTDSEIDDRSGHWTTQKKLCITHSCNYLLLIPITRSKSVF